MAGAEGLEPFETAVIASDYGILTPFLHNIDA